MTAKKSNTNMVCETCPWRTANHGKPHPAKWYSVANLKRLWNGLRKGDAPGMVCHSTDPESKEYGGTKDVKPGHKRECAGALILVIEHVNEAQKIPLAEYRKKHKFPMTRMGFAVWIERYIFNGIPSVADQRDIVSLPSCMKNTESKQ